MEKQLFKYSKYIISGLESKIDELKRIIAPIYEKKQGIIYVIKASNEEDVFKIGKTKYWKKRFNNYNTGKYENVELIYVYETDDIERIETCLKSCIKPYIFKNKTEIYKVDLQIIKESIDNCSRAILIANNDKILTKKKDQHNLYISFDK